MTEALTNLHRLAQGINTVSFSLSALTVQIHTVLYCVETFLFEAVNAESPNELNHTDRNEILARKNQRPP